ncbi:MAG: ATP-binding protein [Myxococcota bacterium]
MLPVAGDAPPKLADVLAASSSLRAVEVVPRLHLVSAAAFPDGEWLETLAAALEADVNGVLIADERGVIEYANAAISRMSGYSREELLGQHTRIFRSGHESREVYQALWSTIRSGVTWNGSLVNRRKDGSTYVEEMTITPVPPRGRRGLRFVAVKRDATAQKRLEDLIERNDRLDLVGRMAASVAHDLANLLMPVASGAALLRGLTLHNEEAKEAVTDIEQAAERAGQLVRQLLDFVRGGRGVLAAVDTSRLLNSYTRQLQRMLPMAVQLEADVPPDLPTVVVDGMQLFQVLLNLCLNAADAMPSGGILWLKARPSADGGLVLEVRDTGTGIPESVRARIFDPFFTTKPPGRGTGIGLAIVKRIIEAHGGTVDFESEVGVGTTFTVTFPKGKP